MALRAIAGIESGDTLMFSTVTGTVAASSTNPRSGTWCLRSNPTTTAVGYVRFGLADVNGTVAAFNVAAGWFGMMFRIATLPSADDEPIFNCRYAGGNKCEVRIDSAGKLQVYDSTGTGLGLGATALEAGRWYRLTFYLTTSATPSAYDLNIDGVDYLSGTGTFTNNNIATYEIGKTADRNGETVDFFYDDICFDDASEPADVRVVWMGAAANGSTFTFTGGSYADVDDTPPNDGDTTYIDDNVSGHVALVTLSVPAIRGPIVGFKALYIGKEPFSLASSVAVRIRTQATDYDNTGRNLTTSYTATQKFYASNPFTSAAWTVDDLRQIEIGAVQGASVAIRITLMGAEVAYTVAPTPGMSMVMEQYP